MRRLNFDLIIEKLKNDELLISEQRKNARIYIRRFFESNDSYLIIELTILSTRFLLNDFKSFNFSSNISSMILFRVIF